MHKQTTPLNQDGFINGNFVIRETVLKEKDTEHQVNIADGGEVIKALRHTLVENYNDDQILEYIHRD